MKVLVIGSKGFLGSHCISYFGLSHEVYGCDVIHDYQNSNYFTISSAYSSYTEIFELETFDVCINCSGAASVPESITNPLRDYELNTVNVFKRLNFQKTLALMFFGNPGTHANTEGLVFDLFPVPTSCPSRAYWWEKQARVRRLLVELDSGQSGQIAQGSETLSRSDVRQAVVLRIVLPSLVETKVVHGRSSEVV